jgi:hypothetical protein
VLTRLLAPVVFLSAAVGQDAGGLLAKAHTAFVENSAHARFWNWTVVSTRTIMGKDGKVLEELPSVTVESPIRSDGKRCNAVLAWGDGREAYLANASADERCAVEKEQTDLLPLTELLESKQVKVRSRTESTITLAIREDKASMESADPVKRCVASVEATIEIDAASFFPKGIDIRVPSANCEQKHVTATDHYDGAVLHNVMNGYMKGTHLRLDYEALRDKGGDALKDYWLCTKRYSERPLQKSSTGIVVSGRLFELKSRGADRLMIIDGSATGSELSAESVLKFATEKDR